MAIQFTSKDSGDTLLIGGLATMGGADSGSIGPFPRYSISREDITTTDGTYVNTKFSISITGTAVIKVTDDQDMLNVGERQDRIQGEALIKMQFNRDQWPMHGAGKLEIDSYGGHTNHIIFNDARLMSLELPEQTEEGAGVQNLEYSFSFEAYEDASGVSNNTGANAAITSPTYLLSSAEESWELSPNEDQMAFQGNDLSLAPYKSFTLTHTLSATGLKKFASGDGLDDNGEAWRQAVLWVGSKLINEPGGGIVVDIMGNTVKTEFDPFYMDKSGEDANLEYNLSNDYKAYNHVRSISTDMAAGSYSVTDTWLMSEKTQNVNHTVEIGVEANPEAPANTISINGTIQGLSITHPGTNTSDKYDNALAALDSVLSNAYTAANSVYTSSGLTGTLRTVELSKTVGHNKGAGTITWSVSYDDLTITCEGALSESITITDDNEDGSNQVVAIIGVIGNSSLGPVIQDMDATTEKKRSISIDITMGKNYRTTKPTCGSTIAGDHIPTGATGDDGPYQQSRTESWNPLTGVYNLSIAWVYN